MKPKHYIIAVWAILNAPFIWIGSVYLYTGVALASEGRSFAMLLVMAISSVLGWLSWLLLEDAK